MSLVSDTHGIKNLLLRIAEIKENYPTAEAVIILGDAGINFYLDSYERNQKQSLSKCDINIYCVRGNHEERPENLGYELAYDPEVMGEVYQDPICANIKYFQDGGEYNINGYKILTIGGAYSVDKEMRLRSQAREDGWTGWFASEQLSPQEKEEILNKVKGNYYDFVLSHTCPYSWEPTDLFLPFLDQSKVDKTTELWLEKIKDNITYSVWCFGHFHADRIEKSGAIQFYHSYENINNIWNEWLFFNGGK